MAKLLLLTGASGALGRWIAPALAERGYALRLSDISDFPDPLPENATFIRADLADTAAVAELVKDSSVVLHFGGISTERHWSDIIGANVVGTVNIFEAAKTQGQRVVFASSNHTIGFYPRGAMLDSTDPYRPDGYYALSKAWGELLGRMMYDKHGLESVHLRIGSAVPDPVETRHLSTWFSQPDIMRALIAAIEAPVTGHCVVWGVSANAERWWQNDDADRIGFVPQDHAEDHGPLAPETDPIARRFQGASFAAQDFTRGNLDDPA